MTFTAGSCSLPGYSTVDILICLGSMVCCKACAAKLAIPTALMEGDVGPPGEVAADVITASPDFTTGLAVASDVVVSSGIDGTESDRVRDVRDHLAGIAEGTPLPAAAPYISERCARLSARAFSA